jgi:hypothetical protein
VPLVKLIFFEDPRELTEAQIEEARELGHLVEDGEPTAADDAGASSGSSSGSAAGEPPPLTPADQTRDDPAGEPVGNDEQGA